MFQLGSQQMYQAPKTLGVDTQLVIIRMSFTAFNGRAIKKDRLERYLAWYEKYAKSRLLQGTATTAR